MSDSGENEQPKKKHRIVWTEAESRALIQVVEELRVLEHLDNKKSKKKNIFQSIQAKLKAAGITRDTKNLDSHWKNLRKKFHEMKAIADKSGEDAVKWPLYNDMIGLIGDRPIALSHENGIESQVPEDDMTDKPNSDVQPCSPDTVQSPFSHQSTNDQSNEENDDSEALDSTTTSPGPSSSDTDCQKITNKTKLSPETSAAPVKRLRTKTEKMLDNLLASQKKTMESQQTKYLEFLTEQRNTDRDNYNTQMREQRAFDKEMMEWKANQTTQMLQAITTTFTQGIAQIMHGNNNGIGNPDNQQSNQKSQSEFQSSKEVEVREEQEEPDGH